MLQAVLVLLHLILWASSGIEPCAMMGSLVIMSVCVTKQSMRGLLGFVLVHSCSSISTRYSFIVRATRNIE